MSTLTRTDVTVARHGNHLLIDAAFLTALLRSAVAEAWEDDRRVEFEEFVYAEAQAKDSEDRDACASGPPETSEETERLVGVADERFADLDLTTAAVVPLADARRLYQLLGVALLAEDGHVGRLIPAARVA
jgi:hypothetical protein